MPQRILIIRYRFIGDTILTVPFIKNLKILYPDSSIDVLVGPQSGKVLENCPAINNLIVFDTTRYHKYDSQESPPKTFWFYAKLLASHKYDIVFCLKRSLGAKLLTYLTGAKERYGYKINLLDNIFLTKSTDFNDTTNEILSTLDVLKLSPKYNSRISLDNKLEYWLNNDEENNIIKIQSSLVSNNDIKLLIHAACAHEDKAYPLDYFAQIINELAKKYKITPYFTGSEIDFNLYQELQNKVTIPCFNLSGKLDLRQSMALYRHMDLAICTDSGPGHLLQAANIPTLVLFGPTDPKRWGPVEYDGNLSQAVYRSDLECRPCNYYKTCQYRECLTQLNPDIVIGKAINIISHFIKNSNMSNQNY